MDQLELTTEEILDWMQKNVPGFDKRRMVLDILMRREDLAFEKQREADIKRWELEGEIRDLVVQHIQGPLINGTHVGFTKEAEKEYREMDAERNRLIAEHRKYFDEWMDISDKFRRIFLKEICL